MLTLNGCTILQVDCSLTKKKKSINWVEQNGRVFFGCIRAAMWEHNLNISAGNIKVPSACINYNCISNMYYYIGIICIHACKNQWLVWKRNNKICTRFSGQVFYSLVISVRILRNGFMLYLLYLCGLLFKETVQKCFCKCFYRKRHLHVKPVRKMFGSNCFWLTLYL